LSFFPHPDKWGRKVRSKAIGKKAKAFDGLGDLSNEVA
jgi:hypothetical protein